MRSRWRCESIVVPLTGGLGNQLFQLAFAIRQSTVYSLPYLLDQGIANPRLTSGHASLFDLSLGNVKLDDARKYTRSNPLLKRIYGWNLLNGVTGRFKRFGLVLLLGQKMSGFLISLRMRAWCSIFVSSGLGYDGKIANVKSGGFFIGYFQTYKFGIEAGVFNQLRALTPVTISPLLRRRMSEVEEIHPILVHVRLTDYIAESSFGILSESYYRTSLRLLRDKGISSPIWIFSDDIEASKDCLKTLSAEFKLYFFNSETLSDVENWHLMRKFSAYVISNSSYSWWAAFLRENQESCVCYPAPWFSSQKDPEELFPKDWIPIPSLFES